MCLILPSLSFFIQTRLEELEQCVNTIYNKLELEKERSEVRELTRSVSSYGYGIGMMNSTEIIILLYMLDTIFSPIPVVQSVLRN